MGNNWQNRDRKVGNKRTDKYLAKPFKRTQKQDSESKKFRDVQIKKAQKAKYDVTEDLDE